MPGPRDPRFGAAALAARLAALAPAGARGWCVAWSGGADSTALLHALVALRDAARAAGRRSLPLRAIHIDHRLQPAAADFRRRCRQLARDWAVPLVVKRVAVEATRGRSVEEAARDARYDALADALHPGECLLVAQHADDQLETFLLQALRGAGVAGLASMPESAPCGVGRLLRPVLGLPQAALRAYLVSTGVEAIEDPSNADLRFDRNYLRHAVLPALRARWPAAARTVSRSARHAALADQVLRDRGSRDAAAAADGGGLDLRCLRCLSPSRQGLALRAWLQGRGLPSPDERVLGEVLRLLELREDAQPLVAWPGAEVRRHGGRLVAQHARPPARESEGLLDWTWARKPVLALPGGGTLTLSRDAWGDIDLRRLPARLTVGSRRAVPAGAADCDLKSLLREAGIPPWQREQVPLLLAGGRLIAVADLWLHPDLQASAPSTARARFVWRRG